MLDRARRPKIQSLEHIELLKPERREMPNGVMLNVIRAGREEVVRLDILVRGGRYQQSFPLQAVMTNRMLREGTRSYTSAQIAEKLDYYGAWLELSSGMEYSFLTVYSLNKYFPQVLQVVESMVKEPAFPERELQIILSANRQQYLVNSRKGDFVAQKYFCLSLFGNGHPRGRTVALDDYNAVTPDKLQTFHDTFYCSANSSLYLSGRVTDDILRETERVFGTGLWGKSRLRTEFIHYPIPTCKERELFVARSESMQNSLRYGYLAIDQKHPDCLKLRVLITLFGDYFGSRLMSNIREDKGYTYGISAALLFYPGAGVLAIATEADAQYTGCITREIAREMQRLKDEPVAEAELSMVRNYMLGQMCRSFEGPFSLADAWSFIETNHLDDDYYRRALEAVQGVTAEDMHRLANEYLRTEELVKVIVGKKNTNKH